MRRILSNQKGVTLLEGLIAMGLLALVAAGTFGVLLSVSHKSGKPDIREEMALAVEKANDQLQAYSQNMSFSGESQNSVRLCAEDTQGTGPLDVSVTHNIACLLPVICDRSHSSFTYTISNPGDVPFYDPSGNSRGQNAFLNQTNYDVAALENIHFRRLQITFNITCNGFTL